MFINVEQISYLLLFFLLLPQVNKSGGWLLQGGFSCVSYFYRHMQKINRGFEYLSNENKNFRQLFLYPKHGGENKMLPPLVSGKNFLRSM